MKSAIVTGGSRGIGAAICAALADAEYSVVVNFAASADAAKKVVEQIQSRGGRAIAVQEKCKIVCRSEKCRGRVIMNCSEF